LTERDEVYKPVYGPPIAELPSRPHSADILTRTPPLGALNLGVHPVATVEEPMPHVFANITRRMYQAQRAATALAALPQGRKQVQ
jgi:hypothetical protein